MATLREAAPLELFKTGLTILILALTWFVGQRVVSYWDLKRKAREVDLSIATQFQQLFGEFKEIWRLWKVYQGGLKPAEFSTPEHTRWQLLARASAAEGRVEAVFVKLASERTLSPGEVRNLGLFRQAYQMLRQGIRDNKPLAYSYQDAEYRLFNELGCKVTHILAGSNSHERPSVAKACDAFEAILTVRSEDWETEVEETRKRPNKAMQSKSAQPSPAEAPR